MKSLYQKQKTRVNFNTTAAALAFIAVMLAAGKYLAAL
jgi:hypothetical protein